MKLLILSLALVLTVSAFDYTAEWEMWKRQYGKQYNSDKEELMRHTIFETNMNHIDNHNSNSDTWGYTLGLNEFADIDAAEFARTFNGYNELLRKPRSNMTRDVYVPRVTDCPSSEDWRTKGMVTPVKNQGQCGSCWAFSTTGSLEGQHMKKTGKLVSLSEQQLVDCSTAEGNHGCQGGLMDQGFTYIQKNKGDDTESFYPYKGENGKCHDNPADVGATCTGFKDIPTKNCGDLQQAICDIGPISVAMDASHMSFQLYRSGIYDPFLCSATKLDHGVLAVGYGQENGKNYFLVKNSWGTTWGAEGYFKIIDRNDKCGICTSASYPLV